MSTRFHPQSRLAARARQAGVTMLTSLIMMIALTMFVLSTVNSTTVNTKVAGNMQHKSEAEGAAQAGIEGVISSNFTTNPQETSTGIDIDGDDVTDYTVDMSKPTCLSILNIKQKELNVENPSEAACLASNKQQPGMPASDKSLCYQEHWDIQANVTDAATGAEVELHQGISKRSDGLSCK